MSDEKMVTPEPEKEEAPHPRPTRAEAKAQAEEEVVAAQKEMFETGSWSGLPQWTCKVMVVHPQSGDRSYELPCNIDVVRDWDRFKEHMFDEHQIVLRDAAQPQEA